MLHVKIVSATPEPEKTVAVAARLCYSATDVSGILDKLTPEKVEKFIAKLLDVGHESPLEHASFTFAVEGISRVLSHQLVRHRIASYSQKSQRYVNEKEFIYITPPSVATDPALKEYYEEQMESIRCAYAKLSQIVPREDARYVLPNACETKIVITMNARSLHNFFRLRCCSRAQWEIRNLAVSMLQEVRSAAPLLFKKAGAPCVCKGFCPEGEMSCGYWERSKQ